MIRLTNLADYAVVLMSYIAVRPQQVYSAADIAAATQIPSPTVSKVLGAMARGGLLVSHRGLNGGFSLARDPVDISVAHIVAVVDGPIALTNCIEHAPGECDMETACRMRAHWQKINDAVANALGAVTLQELAAPHPDFMAPESQAGNKYTPLADPRIKESV